MMRWYKWLEKQEDVAMLCNWLEKSTRRVNGWKRGGRGRCFDAHVQEDVMMLCEWVENGRGGEE